MVLLSECEIVRVGHAQVVTPLTSTPDPPEILSVTGATARCVFNCSSVGKTRDGSWCCGVYGVCGRVDHRTRPRAHPCPSPTLVGSRPVLQTGLLHSALHTPPWPAAHACPTQPCSTPPTHLPTHPAYHCSAFSAQLFLCHRIPPIPQYSVCTLHHPHPASPYPTPPSPTPPSSRPSSQNPSPPRPTPPPTQRPPASPLHRHKTV